MEPVISLASSIKPAEGLPVFFRTSQNWFILITFTECNSEFISDRNLKLLYANTFRRLVNTIDALWVLQGLNAVSQLTGYKFLHVPTLPQLNDLFKKKLLYGSPNYINLEILYTYDYRHGIEVQREMEVMVPRVYDIKKALDRFLDKTNEFKVQMNEWMDVFKTCSKINGSYSFCFDHKDRLVHLSGFPKNMIFAVFSSDWSLDTPRIKIYDFIQSEHLRPYLQKVLSYLKTRNVMNNRFTSANFEMELIGQHDVRGFRGYTFSIKEKSFIEIETNIAQNAETVSRILESKSKRIEFQKTNYLRDERNSFDKKHSIPTLQASSDSIRVEFEDSDPPYSKNASLNLKKKKTENKLNIGGERHKVWSLRHTLHILNASKVNPIADNDKTGQRASHKTELLRQVGSTYAMEYFPDNLNSIIAFKSNLVNDDYQIHHEEVHPGFRKSVDERKKFKIFDEIAYQRTLEFENEINETVYQDWNYDTLALKSKGRLALIMKMFDPHLTSLSINREKFFTFACALKYHYNKNRNPFHNFNHGVSVAFSANYFILKMPQFAEKLEEPIRFAFKLACFAHDVGHTGKNNNYEIHSRSKLALRYNDRSPLEQHHIAKMFSIVYKHQINIFESFSIETFNEMRHIIIECILATDMKVHFSLLAKFNNIVESNEKVLPKEMKELSLCMLIHAADISGSTKRVDLARKWSDLIAQEFTNQYALEVEQKLPVTSYFKDLHLPINFYKSELGFLNFIVKPLYQSLKSWNFEIKEGTDKTHQVLIEMNTESDGLEEETSEVISTKNATPFRDITGIIDDNIEHYEKLLADANKKVAQQTEALN